jgi:hypothetical protein
MFESIQHMVACSTYYLTDVSFFLKIYIVYISKKKLNKTFLKTNLTDIKKIQQKNAFKFLQFDRKKAFGNRRRFQHLIDCFLLAIYI